jgi:hypothetical protein
VDRSTVSAAIRQITPLLADRGFTASTGVRKHTLADILAYAAAEGLVVRLDGTEIQVRRPKAHRHRPASLHVRQAQAEHHQASRERQRRPARQRSKALSPGPAH